jgi:hypothetical protein
MRIDIKIEEVIVKIPEDTQKEEFGKLTPIRKVRLSRSLFFDTSLSHTLFQLLGILLTACFISRLCWRGPEYFCRFVLPTNLPAMYLPGIILVMLLDEVEKLYSALTLR